MSLLLSSVMPRLSTAITTQPKPRLRQVAVTALFATLASSSSSSAFSNCWSSGAGNSNTRPTCATFGLLSSVSRGGSQTFLERRSMTSLDRKSKMSSTVSDTAAEEATSQAAATSMTPAAKLEALRAKMKELNLDAYLVPSDDPHLSGTFVCLR